MQNEGGVQVAVTEVALTGDSHSHNGNMQVTSSSTCALGSTSLSMFDYVLSPLPTVTFCEAHKTDMCFDVLDCAPTWPLIHLPMPASFPFILAPNNGNNSTWFQYDPKYR